MATLDDKLLGEKLHYYCSSSEDEAGDDDDEGGGGGAKTSKGASFIPESELQQQQPPPLGAANTGPKGVIEDWRRYKQLQRENRQEQDRERVELAKKLAMTCRTYEEDELEKAREEQKEDDLDKMLDADEAFLASYMRQRMKQMMEQRGSAGANRKRFGKLIELADDDQFLNAVDSEAEGVPVVVLITEKGRGGACDKLKRCLGEVAADYPSAKVCSILASSTVGLSRRFEANGVPSILVYRGGELVSSFVRVTDALGDDFYASDVESFLVEHGVLQDKELVPQIIRGPDNDGEDSDSD